jgi:hypothetical protein
MSTVDLKKSWEEAIRLATLARQQESELAASQLGSAAGLPVRSGLQAGEDPFTAWCYTVSICGFC